MIASTGNRWLRLLKEGRRRKVYTTAVAYVALSLVLLQVGDAVFQTLKMPVGFSILTVLLVLGFPVVLVLAWIFDLGAGGIERTHGPNASSDADAKAARLRLAARTSPDPVSTPFLATPSAPPPERARPTVSAPASPADSPDPERVQRATLAHVRHELKTPINAIIGYSQMLLEDVDAADAAAADLRRIEQSGRQLLARVESILDPDAAGGQTDLTRYSEQIRADLRDPINAVIGYSEMLLETEADTDSSRASDLQRIRSAALRLLELSTDIVQVATGTTSSAQVGHFSAITETVLAKLAPIGNSVNDERQGVLLVIDDNPLNRDLLSRQLARKGYEVATAENGVAGLQLLDEQSFDLVLLDILMPDMDGIEVLRRIRAQVRLTDTPVIMTSSLDEIDSVVRCLEIGANDYLTKPFDPTLLDARIGACLQLRRLKEREEYFREQLVQRDAMVERVLLGTLPLAVARRVNGGDTQIVDVAREASVLWCDLDRLLVGDARANATEAASRLRAAIGALRQAAQLCDVEVVSLHGSGVLLAAGMPTPCSDHAERIAAAALDASAALRDNNGLAPLRFGLHTGAMAAAVVGEERLLYHVWGDAVELARKLELRADAGMIHVSPAMHGVLKERFNFEARGVLDVAGRQMRTYALSAPTLQVHVGG